MASSSLVGTTATVTGVPSGEITRASREAAPADTRSPAQRLKEIKELKDAGVLSDEEYNAKRAELMKLL